ncbi:Copia protein [Exaiptasia diaphana]|nr:Copia protein [Exaiptasia diaphana]
MMMDLKVCNVARFCAEPTTQHMTAVKRILRYLNGTQDLGLLFCKDGVKECVGYSDSDWAGDLDDRKSTTGYIFHMGGAAVSWRSKKQGCVALSTAEAEYMALASTAQEAVWLRQLLSDLKIKPTSATLIFEDNQAAICLAKNPQFHGRAKHIDIKYHFVREQVTNGNIEVKYCRSEDMVADMMTKGLSFVQFTMLRAMAGVKSMPK